MPLVRFNQKRKSGAKEKDVVGHASDIGILDNSSDQKRGGRP